MILYYRILYLKFPIFSENYLHSHKTIYFLVKKDKHNVFFVCPIKKGYIPNIFYASFALLFISPIIIISFPNSD